MFSVQSGARAVLSLLLDTRNYERFLRLETLHALGLTVIEDGAHYTVVRQRGMRTAPHLPCSVFGGARAEVETVFDM